MKVPSNKISDIYSYYLNLMKKLYPESEAKLMLKRLMGYYLEVQDFKIPQLIENERVGESLLLKIHFGVKDLLSHKPLEYIIGLTDFYEMKFEVNKDVLIPRPETEELVDLIWKTSPSIRKSPSILDVGTGSGCIGIVLCKLLNARVTGIDNSAKALTVAKRNALKNQTEINFFQINFLVENERNTLKETFDIIVSNPPYIRELEKGIMKSNVLNYEPSSALFVPDNNPLIFYEQIAIFGKNNLNPRGCIYVEINEFLGAETLALFRMHFEKVTLIQDLNGKDRFIWVQS